MHANQIFNLYRDADFLTEEDCADFLVIVRDDDAPDDGAMAVTGLTLSLLERQWNEERVLLFMKAYSISTSDIVRERIVVGLLMLMLKYNLQFRESSDLQDAVQDILTDNPELCYTALCNIARTVQVKYLEKFNQQMAKEIMPLMNQVNSDEFFEVVSKHQSEIDRIGRMHLDQNFLIFKTAYYTDFFRSQAANWFLPWNDDQLLNLPEDEREQFKNILNTWFLCDSDKYALIGMSSMIRNTLRDQLQADTLAQLGETLGNPMILANGYVQQLYRYFRLSSFTQSTPFDLVPYMRDMLVYRLVVVGDRAKKVINELLNVL